MRILALTNLYPNPHQPNRAAFNRQQFTALANRHELRVIAPIPWTEGNAVRQSQCDGIEIEHPRYIYPPKILRGWHGHFFRRSVRRVFERIVKDFQPDVVLGTWAYPDGWAAVELGHGAGLPVVVKVHGSDIYLLDEYPSRKRRTFEALTRADSVVAPSRDLANRVIGMGVDPARVNVIYNGVDTQLFNPGSKTDARKRLNLPLDRRIVLFVGNLVPVKGVDILLKACNQLMTQGVDFSCYLVGEGPLKSEMKSVNFIGSKPHAQLPDWYRAADVFILPSYSEGMPNVLLEAAACGTPFIATSVGGIPEIGCGKLVSPGDVGQLAKAIAYELAAPSRNANPLMVLHSFDESAAELATVLQKAIAAHPIPKAGLVTCTPR